MKRGPSSAGHHSVSRRWALGLVTGLIGTAAFACGPSPAGSPASAPASAPTPAAAATTNPAGQSAATQAPAKATSVTKLAFGFPAPFSWQAPYYLGQEKGIYAKYGIELEPSHFDSDTNILKGLIAGELQAADFNTAGALQAISKGATIKVVGAVAPGMFLAVGAKKEIGSLRDLYGKSIGHAAPGDLLSLTMEALFKKEGLDINQVTFVAIGGSPAIVQALVAGKIDAGAFYVDFVPTVSADPNLHVLFVVAERLPEFVPTSLNTRDQLIVERPEVVQNLLLATVESIRYVLTHKDETVESNARRTKLDPKVLSDSFDSFVKSKIWSPDVAIPEGSLNFLQEQNQAIGQQDTILPPDKVANLDFQKQAVAQLGPFKG